jgi:TolA-binding protein
MMTRPFCALVMTWLLAMTARPVPMGVQEQPSERGAQVDLAAERRLRAAAQFFNEGKFEFAAQEYEQFLKEFPDHPQKGEAIFFLGESLLRLKKSKDAQSAYQEYLRRYPDGSYAGWARFRTGELAYLEGDWESADRQLQEFVQRYKTHAARPYALRYLGEAQLKAGKARDAAVTFRLAIEQHPKSPVTDFCRYGLAQILEQQGEKKEALQYYLAVGSGNSEVADDALLAAGVLELEGGRSAHALQLLDVLIQRHPDSPLVATAHYNAGLALEELGRLREAEARFRTVTALAPGTLALEASYRLALVLAALGRSSEAAQLLQQTAEQTNDPSLVPRLLTEAARLLAATGKPQEAIRLYRSVAEKFPQHELAEPALATAVGMASAAGNLRETVALARLFLERFPQSKRRSEVALSAVRAALTQGDLQEADRWLSVAHEAAPKELLPTVDYYRAVLLFHRQQYDQSLTELKALLESKSPASLLADAAFLAGRCYFATGRYAEATEQFRRFLSLQPDDELALHAVSYLALCAASLQDGAELTKCLEALEKANQPELLSETLFQAARRLYDAQDYGRSGELFEKAYRAVSDEDRKGLALAGRGWSAFYGGRAEVALACAEEFLSRYPSHPAAAEVSLLKGYALRRLGRFAEAASAFRETAQKYERSVLAWDARLAYARVLVDLSQFAEARSAYQQLLTHWEQAWGQASTHQELKDFPIQKARCEYAWVLWKTGQNSAAKAVYLQVLRETSTGSLAAEARLNLSQLLLLEGQVDDALRHAELVWQDTTLSEERRAQGAYQAARCCRAQRRWDDLRSWAEKFLQADPSSPEAPEVCYWLGEAALEQNQLEEAEGWLSKAMTAAPKEVAWLEALWLRRFQLAARRGSWEQLLKLVDAYRERFSHPEAQVKADYYKGRAFHSLRRWEEARACYAKALASADPNLAAPSQFYLGQTYAEEGRYREAIREYLKVDILYELPTWRAAALLEAAKCYEQLQQFQAAAELYERVRREFPREQAAVEADRRLQSLRR